MTEEMKLWIVEYLGENNPYGKCAEACALMKQQFPELEVARGHAETSWGRRAHWWLKTQDGTIIDPTRSQFPGGVFSYDEWHPGDEVQVGKCCNCGEEIWEAVQSIEGDYPHKSICGDACARSFEAYLNGELNS